MIKEEMILLNGKFNTKDEVIEKAGQLLYENEYVEKKYIDSMKKRDQKLSVFMGNMIAIPHGTEEGRKHVKKTGLSVIQVPEGVYFDGNEVKLIFGIAANEDNHMDIISNIAILCSDEENVNKLVAINDKEKMIEIIESGEM